MSALKAAAQRALNLMDLTRLENDDSPEQVIALCRSANTVAGHPAAVCVYPRFVSVARDTLLAANLPNVRIATVSNFPAGSSDIDHAVEQTRAAAADGADEIDVVFPYSSLISGDRQTGHELVRQCKDACRDALLKVIIESGELQREELIRQASRIAIEAGADFIKTSTGKVAVNATPEAARLMIGTIRDMGMAGSVGFKAAGGVRTVKDAAQYLAIADELMGTDWADQRHFRLGASGLLSNVLYILQPAGSGGAPS